MTAAEAAAEVGTSGSDYVDFDEPVIGLENCKLVQQGAEAVSALTPFSGVLCNRSLCLLVSKGEVGPQCAWLVVTTVPGCVHAARLGGGVPGQACHPKAALQQEVPAPGAGCQANTDALEAGDEPGFVPPNTVTSTS